jgi:PAS domain S-box-containing protein
MRFKGEKVYLLERRHAFVLSLLISFVVIFGVAWLLAYQSYTKSILATIRSNETRATLLAKLILEHQRAAIGVLQIYAAQPAFVDTVKRRDFGGALKHLIDLVKNNPEMDWPFISNPDSTVWVNHPVDRQVWNKDLSFRDWYKGVSREWKPYISSAYKLIVGEKDLAVAVSVPILDEEGKVIGILATAQSTAFFQKAVGEVALDLDAKTTLIDQEGHIIYSNEFPSTKEVTGYPPLGFVEKAIRGEKGDVEVRDTANQDRIKYVSFAPVEGIGWSVIVEKPRSEVLRSEIPNLAMIGVIALLLYGLSVLILVHLRQRHRQIQRLEELNEELDSRVRERTAELETGNNALRESEERYRLAIQASNDAIWDLNLTAGTVQWNEIYAASFGRPPETSNSWQWWIDHLHPEDRDRVAGGLQTAIDGEANNWVCEYRFMRADGTWADIYDRAYIARDKSGKAWRVVGAMQDLTERKRAEEQILKSENELLLVMDTVPALMSYIDAGFHYRRVNQGYQRWFGLAPQELMGRHVREALGEDAWQVARPRLERAMAGETVVYEEEMPYRTGGRRWVLATLVPDRDAAGKVQGLVALVTDITERKRVEEALQQRTLELQHLTETLEQRVKERTAELSDLTSQIVSAQEDERRRISYDLHDNVWQTLLAIRSEIERLFSDRNLTDREASQNKAKKVMEAILDMVGKIRSMQGDLWPYVLDDIGILATLDWYCREFEKKHSGLTIDSHTEFGEGEVLSPVKIVIYRILQETLSNVAKHSRASHVTLRLIKKDHGVEFSVEDNGIGFDPVEVITKRTPWGGLGLSSIKARTELSGGTFEVQSAKGKGTTVRAIWPI